MAHEPSLYHLFRRSRYSRSDGEERSELGKNRMEEFAVAALGLVLQHDAKFKKEFMERICGLNIDDQDLSKYRVTCQDGDCADLSIVREGFEAIIIEAKLRADLDNHQMPWEKCFWERAQDERKAGYGFQIREHQKLGACPKKHFILVQKEIDSRIRHDSRDPRGGCAIRCESKAWRDLADLEVSPLVTDLLDSLAKFGVPTLVLRKHRNMRIEPKSAREASQMHEMLRDFAAHGLLINSSNINWYIDHENEEYWFGVDVPKELKAYTEWSKLAAKDVIGWFGYEMRSDGSSLSVWLYGDADSGDKMKTFALGKLGSISGEDGAAVFKRKPSDEAGESDIDWLTDIFRKLRDGPLDPKSKKSK